MTTAADLLDEYGEAIRDSWGDIDGRTERDRLQGLAQVFREKGNEPLTEEEVLRARQSLGVCERGEGHWYYFCDEGWRHQDEEQS